MSILVREAAPPLSHAHLLDPGLWSRLIHRIADEDQMELSLAERVMDQALGFLRLVAAEPDANYSPSAMVDIGWHAIILYTRDYAALCRSLSGSFIHHTPLDAPGDGQDPLATDRTVQAMRARDLCVDMPLWDGSVGECGGHKCKTCVL